MTEESYQQGRKLMQRANYMRGMITKAKGNVAKWTKIEMAHRENLNEGQANGARNALEKALKKLEEMRKRFTELKFPEDNIQAAKSKEYRACQVCDTPTTNERYCDACQEDYLSLKVSRKSF